MRHNDEVDVFLPLQLTQRFVRKWIDAKKKAKIVFTSSMGGLFTPANWEVYVSTKHALESVAEALKQELEPYGIKVQTINPGAFDTGYNETMADERRSRPSGPTSETEEPHFDAREMIDIVPADTVKFRIVVLKATEDMLKAHQLVA